MDVDDDIDKMDVQPLEYLCSKLITTYNTTILDKMGFDMEEALRQEAKCETTNKERKVLKELIRRHYEPNLESRRQKLLPDYIGGPFNLTCHWSEYYQKLIYIFGEEHSEKTDCHEFDKRKKPAGTLIENFLKELIEISDCFLDLLVEFEAYKGYKYKNELSENKDGNRLVQIAKTFSSCINASERDQEENKPKCSCSRIHYFDVRSIERNPEEKGPDDVSHFIVEYINITNGYITEEYYIDDLTENESYTLADELIKMTIRYQGVMKGFLLKFGDKEFLKFWYGMLSKNHYTKKELDHLGEDKLDKEGISIKTRIERFIENEILLELETTIKREDTSECTSCSSLINTLAQSIIDNIILPYRVYSKNIELIEDLLSLINLIIIVNASVIDAYLLARIFKKFDLNSEKPKKRRSTDEPDEARNIIIYAGNKHCTTYRKFLTQHDFELFADIGEAELEYGKKPSNCVNMRSKDKLLFKKWTMQPLFSKWPPEKDPDLGVKEVKKSWGCNVMFRSKQLRLKKRENKKDIMDDSEIKRSPKRTSPKTSKGIKKTTSLK